VNRDPSKPRVRDWRFTALTIALAAQIFFSTLLGSWVHPTPYSAEPLAKDVPSALRAVGYLTGFKLMVGHLFWIRVIQYYGNSDNASDRYSKLYGYCSLASDLNPNFIPIYAFGAAALSFHLKRPLEATKLLQKGILANPKEIRLKLLYAAIAYQNTQQYDKVIPFLEAQIARGDAPDMLVRILANTYAEVGRTRDAIALWQKILKQSDDQAEQIEAAQKLKILYPLLQANPKPKKIGETS
jgi:tetratricopeptide (TPR) repeat protein